MEGFLTFFQSVSETLKVGGIFLLFNGLTAINGIILICFKLNNKAGKSSIFISTGIALFSLFFSFALLFSSPNITATERVVCVFSTLSANALFCVPIFMVFACKKEKSKENNEQAYQFIRGIDKQIKKEENADNLALPNSAKILKCVEEKEQKRQSQIDFSHVKSVIDRISGYELSVTDRRAVRELEIALFDAEKRGEEREIKSRLNDGLNSLLKIMAKYGV